MRGQHALRRGGLERRPAGEHLVGHHAEGVDVGAVIDVGIGGGLLGRHVGRGAESHAGGSEGLAAGGLAHRFRHAEIGDQGVASRQQHILRLDVAVDHAPGVCGGERIGHVAEDANCFRHGELTLLRQLLPERQPLDVRHDVVEEALRLSRVVHRQDVGVLEVGGNPDLLQKPLGPQRGGQLGSEHLERDLALVPEVVREVNRGHPALAQFTVEAVAVSEGRGEVKRGVRHGQGSALRLEAVAGGAGGSEMWY